MSVLKKTMYKSLLSGLAILSLAAIGLAQGQYAETNIQRTVRRLQSRIETLRSDVEPSINRSGMVGGQVNQFSRSLSDFRAAVDQLDQRLSSRQATTVDAQLVLDRGTTLDRYLVNDRFGPDVSRDWQ